MSRPQPRPQLTMTLQNRSKLPGALPLEDILADPSIAENRPFYCHRAYVNQGFEVAVGDEGFVRAVTRQGDTIMLATYIIAKRTSGWTEAKFVHVNGNAFYSGEKQFRLLFAESTALEGHHFADVDVQRNGVWFETLKSLLTAWRVSGAEIPPDIAAAINTDAKIFSVVSRIVEGYRRAGGLQILDRGGFHIDDLLRVLPDALESHGSGNFISIYDAGVYVGKASDFQSCMQRHNAAIKSPGQIEHDHEQAHYEYTRKAETHRHRIVYFLEEEFVRRINEQLLYYAFESEEHTVRRLLANLDERNGSDLSRFIHAIEANGFIAIRQAASSATGWRGFVQRPNSGVIDGLNLTVPICENTTQERRVWVQYPKADGSKIFSTQSTPAYQAPGGGVQVCLPGGVVHQFEDIEAAPKIGADVYARYTIEREGVRAQHPLYNSIGLQLSNEDDRADGLVCDVLYQYEPGKWKAVNAMNINRYGGDGELEAHFVESMRMRRLLLRQRVEIPDDSAKAEPLGRIYRATYNNWLQTIDIVQVTEVERVNPTVPTTWEERAASLYRVGASFEGKVHPQCDYCNINNMNNCKWYKEHSAARCQNCLDVGIPCTFSSAALVDSGGAIFDLLARASTKYGRPEARDIDDPQPVYKAARDL